jgi:CrcB protein
MQSYLLIALGSALGGAARYACSAWLAHRLGETFPCGTFSENVAGSYLIGHVAALTKPDGRYYLSPESRQFLMIGVFGGFTTFSSFSLQTLALLREGAPLLAVGNVVLSVSACLLAVWAGYVLAFALGR